MFLLIGYLIRIWKRRKAAANSTSAVAEHHGG
jgi:hypothetical protein